jgi:hypothetical protein
MGKAFIRNYGPTVKEKVLTSKGRPAFGKLSKAQL